ncbi:MAG: DUF4783 domain-containing protein [Ignavibacteriales bacterium]|nr:DUF4783 domain-containing protein [Ignavibacteriales bacterium]
MKILLIAGITFLHVELLSQANSFLDRKKPVPIVQEQGVKKIFESVEKGVSSGSVPSFSGYLGPQVHVNIAGQNDGYFSANQTRAVLQNYFLALKPVSFIFSRFQEKGENPYATGRLVYVLKGNRESVQVYVSLALHDSKWVISQFNVY